MNRPVAEGGPRPGPRPDQRTAGPASGRPDLRVVPPSPAYGNGARRPAAPTPAPQPQDTDWSMGKKLGILAGLGGLTAAAYIGLQQTGGGSHNEVPPPPPSPASPAGLPKPSESAAGVATVVTTPFNEPTPPVPTVVAVKPSAAPSAEPKPAPSPASEIARIPEQLFPSYGVYSGEFFSKDGKLGGGIVIANLPQPNGEAMYLKFTYLLQSGSRGGGGNTDLGAFQLHKDPSGTYTYLDQQAPNLGGRKISALELYPQNDKSSLEGKYTDYVSTPGNEKSFAFKMSLKGQGKDVLLKELYAIYNKEQNLPESATSAPVVIGKLLGAAKVALPEK